MKTLPVTVLSAMAPLVLGIAFALPAAAMPAAQSAHDHANHPAATPPADDPTSHADHHADAVITAIPADHVQWTPDAPLMEGMQRVRDAMSGLEHHEMGHLDESQVDQLATQVDEAVAYMFANCKLEAAPDVALHGLLARFMAGAEALHASPADPAPVADMRAALQDYPRLFDDPGFARTAEDDGGEDAGDHSEG